MGEEPFPNRIAPPLIAGSGPDVARLVSVNDSNFDWGIRSFVPCCSNATLSFFSMASWSPP